MGGVLMVLAGVWLMLQTVVGGLPGRLLSRREYAPGESPAELGAAVGVAGVSLGASVAGGAVVAGRPDLITWQRVTLDKRAMGSWQSMVRAAAADGIELAVSDSFRTTADQIARRRQYCAVDNLADIYNPGTSCSRPVAVPGRSDHELGLAVDVIQGNGEPVAWLRAHAAAFGWRETVAGEPWHWAYRGGES